MSVGSQEEIGQSQCRLETILHEIHEKKDAQLKEKRLDKIEEVLYQIPPCIQEQEQRVSDLEDHSLVWDRKISHLQKKLFLEAFMAAFRGQMIVYKSEQYRLRKPKIGELQKKVEKAQEALARERVGVRSSLKDWFDQRK
ncbi:hypothetical protein NDU88_003390 [Pleurodeles waltl]|uniref:Uncharacterized protein n=1 Tax=Pleurodeles waltl TaxID=8319 RepID=A0AAV7WTH9_PLEWA|nr:hypothetical protein NDU88_003390 [Pleurodeles waltl]